MDPLREALQHIKKMVCGDALPRWVVDPQVTATRMQIADICDAALQQAPAQEPVAWIQPDHLQKASVAPFLCRVEPTKRMADFVPIYTEPPKCYTSN